MKSKDSVTPAGSAPAELRSVFRDDPYRIRLMKVVTSFAGGGTEGQVHNLVKLLDRTRFDLRMGCLHKSGFFLEEVERWKIPVKEFHVDSLYKPKTFLQQLKLAAYLRKHRIQIMHSYNFYSNVFAIPAARLAGVPLILASIRDRGVYLNRRQKHVQKWACGLADKILVNAESIREWLLEEGYQADKIVLIKNGIDLSLYNQARTNTAIHKEFDLPLDAPLVVMLARLNRQKGIDDFLQAAALVNRAFPQARYLVVGEKLDFKDGELVPDLGYLDYLQQFCTEQGIQDRVVFAGHRTDVPALLAEATMSVLPSHSEGLSNTLLESMAAGVPVVATRVGGNPELIQDGVNGILVPPLSPVALAEAINNLLANPALAKEFGCRSKQIAEKQFAMQRMVSATQDLYRSQLEGKVPLVFFNKAGKNRSS